MAMAGGSVTIDKDGNASGSGAALDLYTTLLGASPGIPAGAEGVPNKRALASTAEAFGTWMVTYLQGNAELFVNEGGMQNSTTAGTATAAPGAPFTGGGLV